ncbi:MAG: Bifunctional protein GlmU [Candidatus Gottesmanbacteria bacterium GW2011_GWA2_47_9]|uniref:Bifunctional protein GlmU n=2 Tax=Candidatus Gottesmaniibacteriota TaxID=1752720 RepID=A0A0G1UNJ6_9BACT|nr:MAG: Bifunctional protein GlmU [Candidatus Gottesmanbacteria bacterium GW2011_GWA2_47_9]KKU95714.1 MAG: Bifunctional protein GlmU [Candidatus Gottesmanbacteria bacterium GW2011_GWA1_48_13]
MKKDLVAVILAGGAGSRFWPLTTNKIVFPFFGKPLFDFSVRDVLPKDVSRAVIVASPDNRNVLQTQQRSVPTVTVVQQKPMGMADALLSAASEIADCELIILIADDLLDRGLLARVVSRGRSTGAFGVIAGWRTEKYFPGGYLKIENDRITGIVEKPGEGKAPSPYVAISGHYIRNSDVLLTEIKRTRGAGSDDIYERTLTSLAQHEEFVMEPYEGSWISLKYPWHVLDAMHYLLSTRIKSHRGKGVEIRDHVTIEGEVYLDDGVKIFENSKIVGPCYVGKHTIIGNNNIIRASHLGANCITGFSSDISRSYIGDDCWFHTNYMGDSVMESDVSMGSGAAVANLRLDDGEISTRVGDTKVATGRNKLGGILATGVRIGVNASIMPGVKIGKGSFIGSGVVLDNDLPERSFCVANTAYTVKRNIREVAPGVRNEFRKQL